MGSSRDWRRLVWALPAGWVLLVSGPALAGSLGAVIYDNGLAFDDSEIFGPDFEVCNCFIDPIAMFNPSTGRQTIQADDFSLGTGTQWAVTGAAWIGNLFEDFVSTGIGIETTFDLLFFADAGGLPTGTPLDPIPGTAIAHRQVAVIGERIFPDDATQLTAAAQYAASFDPVALEGATPYWFAVVARGEFTQVPGTGGIGTGWVWYGRRDTGNGHQGGTGFRSFWGANARQMAFTLSGTAVPEPSGALSLILACAALMLLRSRLARPARRLHIGAAATALLLPQSVPAAGFDFSLLELEITGQNAFFDDFEDGDRNSPPTSSLFTGSTPTTESGGALLFTDTDGSGINADGVPFDTVRPPQGRVCATR